ncbi:hypothetical protein AVEN_196403-1 [Araneus ventricosus]|uniref:Uncharacterized protein n=1 Tax=Araneus ventricosus TaxID=182803 RepID=A0A4Y2AWC1_ARAVE|nr:hypothetical protein AVEN_196403-1 [Araneus ventricosus]
MTRTTPELTTTSANFFTTATGGHLDPMYDLACSRPTYTVDLQWNRASNLEHPPALKPRPYHWATAAPKDRQVRALR